MRYSHRVPQLGLGDDHYLVDAWQISGSWKVEGYRSVPCSATWTLSRGTMLYVGAAKAQPGDSGPQLRLGARVVVDSPLMSNSARRRLRRRTNDERRRTTSNGDQDDDDDSIAGLIRTCMCIDLSRNHPCVLSHVATDWQLIATASR